tara:strand:- start:288 stop:593 length:306 start_codon:yes stop_codon:yes gene_type:complete
MKTQNRKNMYSNEIEDLADLLANKSRDDIYDILEAYDSVLVLTFTGKYTAIQRAIQILTIPTVPLFFILMGIKWIITGDKYLNTWLCKIGLSASITNKYFI